MCDAPYRCGPPKFLDPVLANEREGHGVLRRAQKIEAPRGQAGLQQYVRGQIVRTSLEHAVAVTGLPDADVRGLHRGPQGPAGRLSDQPGVNHAPWVDPLL